jgi:hypothetical protein
MKQIFIDHWLGIDIQEKISIKDYLLNFLASKGPTADKSVLKMIISLLSKIVKMSWFDHPAV